MLVELYRVKSDVDVDEFIGMNVRLEVMGRIKTVHVLKLARGPNFEHCEG